MKKYTLTWLLLLTIVGLEYYSLNFIPQWSLLLKLQSKGYINSAHEISPLPGRIVSLWLGWIGLALMITMNLYSMRKRFSFMQGLGRLSDWLNLHIFCGLLGPSLILFHCNFKVRGLVAISFWSMVVSFSSGIIGRYFYVQLARSKNNFETESERREQQLSKFLETKQVMTTDEELKKFKHLALNFVGLKDGTNGTSTELNPFFSLINAIEGDVRLYFKKPKRPQNWPVVTEYILTEYALNKRRALFLAPFQKLMGYWHNFHFPFAIFMYVVAVIHVAAALVLGV